ncbi:hypothetical protein ACNO6Z_06160 [Aliarcobacter lanthieri]|uniref:hypothetical protein n=1 Tax=Aliarcobacter lanthieri TaxID=1355374 RepID=UPI003AA91362
MRNYISVNAKYYKMSEIDRISSHNYRQTKIDYLLPREQVKFENKNIVFNENLQATRQDLTLKNLDLAMRLQFTKLLDLKQKILKKNNAKRRKNENEIIEMVVALSEEQALNYLENDIDLMQGFESFAKNINKKYGLKPLAISLHLDEGNIKDNITKLNVHTHITFFNYDFEKEKSVLRTLKKEDWKGMQDIAQDSFKEVGLDFQRGESKDITGKEHLERNDFILEKQLKELKAQVSEINTLKNEEKELLKNLEKGTLEYNKKYKEVGKLISQEKELRNKIKELKLNTPRDFSRITNDTTNNIVNKYIEKPLVGGSRITKIENLKKDINQELNNAYRTTLLIDEHEKLEKENKALKTQVNTLNSKVSNFRNKFNELEKFKDTFVKINQKNVALERQRNNIKAIKKQFLDFLKLNNINIDLRRYRSYLKRIRNKTKDISISR